MLDKNIGVSKGFYIKVVLAILVVVAGMYFVYDLNGSSLDLSDREVRLIVTDSMDGEARDYPISTIPKDSIVMIHHLDDAGLMDLKVGDVLAYRSLGLLFTHRIIAIDYENRVFTTQGDNTVASERVSFASAEGNVVGVSHWMGQAAILLKQHGLFIGLMVLIAIAGYEAIRWILRNGERDENPGTVPERSDGCGYSRIPANETPGSAGQDGHYHRRE